MINLDQITEQGVRLDLQGLIILKDWKGSTETYRKRDVVKHDGEFVNLYLKNTPVPL